MSFAEMDYGFGRASDSASISDLQPIIQNDEEMRRRRPRSIEDMDDTTLDDEIKELRNDETGSAQFSSSHGLRTSSEFIPVVEAKILSPNSRTVSNLKGVDGETSKERKRRQRVENDRKVRERIRQTENPEERAGRLAANMERRRKYLANQTPEKKAERLVADAERHRKYLSKQTPEQRAARIVGIVERKKTRLANETEDQRKSRLASEADYRRKRLAKESPEQRTARLSVFYNRETPEQRSKRLERYAERHRKRLANETPEQRTKRLVANAKCQRRRLANQTPEHNYSAKSIGDHIVERNRKRLSDETLEQRTARLITATSSLVQCKYCEKSLGPKSLNIHILRYHSRAEDRKFNCDNCEKTFGLECDRKAHMLTHSQEKHFMCHKCGKCYKENRSLKEHVIMKHRFDEDSQEKHGLE